MNWAQMTTRQRAFQVAIDLEDRGIPIERVSALPFSDGWDYRIAVVPPIDIAVSHDQLSELRLWDDHHELVDVLESNIRAK